MVDQEFKFIAPGEVRTRFAPSPTGYLHIGSARTALFNYLFAKKNQGIFVLRIEDTDIERSNPEFEKDILEGLGWLGIVWQEGPWRQSERTSIYRKYLEKLLEEEKAYHCFCPEDELEAQRQYALSQGQPWRYNGQCAKLLPKEIKNFLAEGKPSIIRFKTASKKVSFEDIVRGKVEFDASLIGDFAIAKNADKPLYNLAVVVDDFEMKISYVIRGEDHIANTPKQILIQEALNIPQPRYAHLPLILSPDRSKLSKRHGAVAIAEFRKQGYLPEALVNFMAFLGWNPGGELAESKLSSRPFAGTREREIFSLPSLIKEFSLEKVQKGGAVFNLKRLDFLNGFYIRQKSVEKLAELCSPYLIEQGLINKEEVNLEYLKKIVSIYQERLKILSEITELTDFFFKEKLDYDKSLLKWKEMEPEEVKARLYELETTLSKIKTENWTKENLEKTLLPLAEKRGDRGQLLWPLRAALTGKEASAPPFEVAEILGKEKTIKRIKEAIELFAELR